MQPKLMLFDEPTSALDPELVGDVLDVMRGLAKRRDDDDRRHPRDRASPARSADTVVFMDDGVVVEAGRRPRCWATRKHERTQSVPVEGAVAPARWRPRMATAALRPQGPRVISARDGHH